MTSASDKLPSDQSARRALREDLDLIVDWFADGSSVLDLGCGDGTLLAYLAEHRGCFGYGLEIDPANISRCIRRGVNVIEQDLDYDDLSVFKDKSFDVVVMTQALQAVKRPDITLEQMLRIGREGIVTFPNFGYWRLRWYLWTKGRMPESRTLPYHWYDTPNIHLCTFKDFEALCEQLGIKILRRSVVDERHNAQWLSRLWPNAFGQIALYHITRQDA